jgi:hypothetical protein
MTQMLDCLVNYFGLDENEQPGFRRYFSYHILAGSGPTTDSGVAWITTLALSDESQRCTYCQNVHEARTGGPEAALAAAISYLDAFHEKDRLRKVQSPIRGLDGDRLEAETANRPTPARKLRARNLSVASEEGNLSAARG